jgi:hypothetical protein
LYGIKEFYVHHLLEPFGVRIGMKVKRSLGPGLLFLIALMLVLAVAVNLSQLSITVSRAADIGPDCSGSSGYLLVHDDPGETNPQSQDSTKVRDFHLHALHFAPGNTVAWEIRTQPGNTFVLSGTITMGGDQTGKTGQISLPNGQYLLSWHEVQSGCISSSKLFTVEYPTTTNTPTYTPAKIAPSTPTIEPTNTPVDTPTTPQTEALFWDRSNLSVEGHCDTPTGEAIFRVTNTSTSNMTGLTNWRMYQDGVLMNSGTLRLAGGVTAWYRFPGQAGNLSFEVDQRPGYPGDARISASASACSE